MFWLLALSGGLISSRLVFLNVFSGDHLKSLASANLLRDGWEFPNRGVITDRNGVMLAHNIEYSGRKVRHYPFGELTSHVVGYMGRVDNERELCSPRCEGDLVGKTGIERQYQLELAGKPARRVYTETAEGAVGGVVSEDLVVMADDIRTTIDIELTKIAHRSLREAIGETGGSGVVMVSRVSGEVLSMVSLPSYDSNLFVPSGKRSDFGGLYADIASTLGDKDKIPLLNRAMAGAYPPGSVFKPWVALLGLTEGKIDADTSIVDTGEIRLGDYRYGNWYLDKYGRTEGALDVTKALSRSNNVFFYKLGEYLGVDRLVTSAERYGVGSKTGIDIPGEVSGFLPTPIWKERQLGEKWFLGNTYHFAIGQSQILTTPLQMDRLTASVVSGQKCMPYLVKRGECQDMGVSQKNIDLVLSGMRQTCEPGGTAYPLFDWAGQIYCKTGTAQPGGRGVLPHAWMSVVVPRGDKVLDWVVITVLVVNGGEGSSVAAPVAKPLIPYIIDNL
jgi:penicillin-binding protein 2